ncbi:beta-methylgalactoside transporter [Anaerococcus sp. AGMB09787]|uniref:ABC transporter permease subunit n=1 Tax=Anaerococcus sp. AGMB09787 TaxID=2922869 RepID=UPI001FB00B8A|nr:beta-methylgalactoside transporter [Anaerococcus sp. AGMB09787]
METQTKKSFNFKEFILNNALIIIIGLLILGIIIVDPTFITNPRNIINILSQTSTRLFIALGTGGLLILAGTDLSAGRIVGFTAAVAGALLQSPDFTQKFFPNIKNPSIFAGLFVAIAIGALCGAINGFGVAYLRLHAFIASLGVQLAIFGILQIFIASNPFGPQPIGGFADKYANIVRGGFKIPGTDLQFPYLIIYAAIASVVMWFIWNKTVLGKNMFAVGGNPEAAEVSGINVKKTIMIVFLISGIMYGLSGFLEGPRLGSVTSTTGESYDLDAIEACLIGGVSFSGGIGTIPGIVLGSIILQVINYGLLYIGLNSYVQIIIKGILIILTVALDTRKRIKKK